MARSVLSHWRAFFLYFIRLFGYIYNIHNYFIHFKYLLVDFRCLVESFLTQMELVNYA